MADVDAYEFQGRSNAQPMTIVVTPRAAMLIAGAAAPPSFEVLSLYADTIRRIAARKIERQGEPADRTLRLEERDV